MNLQDAFDKYHLLNKNMLSLFDSIKQKRNIDKKLPFFSQTEFDENYAKIMIISYDRIKVEGILKKNYTKEWNQYIESLLKKKNFRN